MIWRNQPLRTHIATHLTIDPSLDLLDRLTVARELGQMHTLQTPEWLKDGVQGNVVLAFFEEAKSLSRSVRRISDAQNIFHDVSTFQQAILNTYRLGKYSLSDSIKTRPVTANDDKFLLECIHRQTCDGLAWYPSVETMWYHYTTAPDNRVWIAEADGKSVGFLAGYKLQWIKESQQSAVFVVETLFAPDKDTAAALLVAASQHTKAENLRGVVFENPAYLTFQGISDVGITLTPRTMVALARSKVDYSGCIERFICDIK